MIDRLALHRRPSPAWPWRGPGQVARHAVPFVQALVGRPGWRHERLVLVLPMLILPTVGSLADLTCLLGLWLLVWAFDAVLAAPGERPAGQVLAAAVLLGAAFAFGAGTALAFALFMLARTVEHGSHAAPWPVGLFLAGLSTAVLLDLAQVALGLERSSLWLALAAAIGVATAAARPLATRACPTAPERAQGDARRRALREVALLGAIGLILALYAALLAQDPTLRQLAGSAHYLALPVLAAALGRWAQLALAPAGRPRADPIAILLLALWALAGQGQGPW